MGNQPYIHTTNPDHPPVLPVPGAFTTFAQTPLAAGERFLPGAPRRRRGGGRGCRRGCRRGRGGSRRGGARNAAASGGAASGARGAATSAASGAGKQPQHLGERSSEEWRQPEVGGNAVSVF